MKLENHVAQCKKDLSTVAPYVDPVKVSEF